jgi:hypothetical protein
MKLRSVKPIGRSQLIPGAGPTHGGWEPGIAAAGQKCQMIADLMWRSGGLLVAEAYDDGRLQGLK